MINLYQWAIEWICHFAKILFSLNFTYGKFRENKTLTKISELTVLKTEALSKAMTLNTIDLSLSWVCDICETVDS